MPHPWLRIIASLALLFAGNFCVWSASPAAEPAAPFNIILFHNYHQEDFAVQEFGNGLLSALQQNPNVKIYHEHLDAIAGNEKTYLQMLAQLIKIKYSGNAKPSLFICPEDHTLAFMLDYCKDWLPEVPVIACNITVEPPAMKKSNRHFTVIKHPWAVADTVIEAARLYPGTDKLIIINDADTATPDTMLQLEGLHSVFKIENVNIHDPLSRDRITAMIDNKTIVLFISSFPFMIHNDYRKHAELQSFFSSIPAPVFAIQKSALGTNVIGGKMPNLQATGKLVGKLALATLQGQAEKAPLAPASFFFDYRILKKFKIDHSSLPVGSVIVNQPNANIFTWLPWIIVVFMIESALVLCLFVLYRKSRNAHRELQSSARQWRSLTENLPDIIFRIDRDGKLQYINHNIEKTFDVKVEDIIGKTARILKLAPSEEYRKDALAIFEHGRQTSRELNVDTPTGQAIIESRLVPEHDAAGNIISVLGISRDITRQKMASRELALQQFVVASTRLPIMIVRPDGKISYANAAAVEMFGGDAGGINGRNLDSMNLRFENCSSTPELLKTVLNKRHLCLDASHIRNQEQRQALSLIFSCLQVENDDFICLFIQDITAQKRSQEEMTAAKERAEKSDRLKSSFLANVSHEIRTPLNGILGFAELLKYAEDGDVDRRKYIDIIYESGTTLLHIIEDILDISKIESGQIKVNHSEFHLTKLLEEIYQIFRHKTMVTNDKVEFYLRLPPLAETSGIPIRTDEIRLRQILNNLLSNATKFTPQGSIELGCRLTDQNIEVYVRDSGIGIPPDKQKLIFEPFRQADDSISRTYGGTGLGLAIASSYARLLEGKITLESEPGRGSIFTLILPRGPDVAIEIGDIPEKAQPANCKWPNRKILIAEDDYTSFLFINKIISDTGAQVVHVENGLEAVRQCIADRSINAVLMDVRLPELNGWEATRKIKATRPRLPVIIETANALNQDREKAAACGSDGFLSKPIRKEDLLAALSKFFD